MANKILNAVSSRFTVDNIITEKIAIGQKQLGTTIANEHNMSLYGDETRKFGKIFQTFLVSDENKNVYFWGFRDTADKSASTTSDVFQNILDDTLDMCEPYSKTGNFSPDHGIFCKIRNFMYDRTNTNLAFTDLLEQYRTEEMPKVQRNKANK